MSEEDPEAKLKSLKRSRSGHKAYSTKIGKETEGLLPNAIDGNIDIEKMAFQSKGINVFYYKQQKP